MTGPALHPAYFWAAFGAPAGVVPGEVVGHRVAAMLLAERYSPALAVRSLLVELKIEPDVALAVVESALAPALACAFRTDGNAQLQRSISICPTRGALDERESGRAAEPPPSIAVHVVGALVSVVPAGTWLRVGRQHSDASGGTAVILA